MFLILKLALIILINKTYEHVTQDSEIILLPAWNLAGAKEISLAFKVFDKSVQLNMRRNNQIVSPVFEAWSNDTKDVTEKLSELKASNSCFHLYENYSCSAAINICQEYGLEGLIFLENNVLEIRPLQNVFESLSMIDDFCVKEQINLSFGRPHLIKRSLQHFAGSNFYNLHKIVSKRSYEDDEMWIKQNKFTIELAVFVDTKAYNSLIKLEEYFGIDHIEVMLAYINRIQDLYYHPSLGVQIDISLVRLDFMKRQPPNLPIDKNIDKMLYSFCKYATNLNPLSDDDPRHWDIALYITGQSFLESRSTTLLPLIYSIIEGKALGKACSSNSSCVIVSLFTDTFNNYTKPDFYIPYELRELIGFMNMVEYSTIAVHEIGHLLGLEHDSVKEPCTTYVMCTGSILHKEIKWSPLSRYTIITQLKQKPCLLDHTQNINYDGHYWSKYAFDNSICHDYHGRKQTAKAQCELFLHDEDANVVTLHDICKSLQCETPTHKNKFYFTGYALNGTYCAPGKECCNGKCVPIVEPPYIFKYCKKDNWSEWKEDSCQSSCLVKSKGRLVKRRFCKHRGRRTANCTGPYYDVNLCDDSLLCTKKRTTIAEFTTIKCNEFRKFTEKANMTVKLFTASGYQMFHDVQKPWIACTIFCRRRETFNWYAPLQEMLNNDVDPYFPDGTWCHNNNGQNYYCRQHYCLPENYSFVESKGCMNNC